MFSDFEKFDPQGAQIAVDYVNSQGGLTINGQKYNVELFVLDGKASSEGVTQAANAMVYDKNIMFICGEGVTPLAIAVDTVTEQAGAIFSARFSNSSPNEMGPKFPLKFVGGNCYFSCMKAALSYLHKSHPEIKNFAFEAIDDGTLKTATPVINKFAGEAGLQMLGDVVGFDFSVQDMTPIVQKVMALNPDAVMMGAMTQTCQALSIKQLRALGYKGPLFACTPENMNEAVEVVGKDAFDGFFAIGFPGDPAAITSLPQVTQDMVKIGIKKYSQFNMTQWQGANGAYSMLMAIKAAQSLDPKVVAKKWETLTTIETTLGPGTMGGLKTYGANHNVYHPTPIQAYISGETKLMGVIPLEDSVIP
jgi:branched-chain amino acid transport system substrate-binding protein